MPTPTLVVATAHNNTAHKATTSAVDTTGADLIVLSFAWWEWLPSGNPTWTDSKGNTWVVVTPQQSSGTGTDMRQQFAYCFNPTVGAGHTFEVLRADSYPGLVVHAFSGASTYSYQTRSGAGGNVATPLACGSVTPTYDRAIVVTGYVLNRGTLPAGLAASGFSVTTCEGVASVNFPCAAAYAVQPASAINPTWAWTDGGTYGTAVSSAVFSGVATGGFIDRGVTR